MNGVSDNTKAILLLTAPLIVSSRAIPAEILSLKDYNTLARGLHRSGFQPKDLLGPDSQKILEELPSPLHRPQLSELLNRGFLLGQALIEWQRRSIWVSSRADPTYPKRLKARLRDQAPAVIYGCGDFSLLDRGGLAVVGSRETTDQLKRDSEAIGALAAESQISIVSGAARGIDRSAMDGALENGGTVVGMVGESLGQAAIAKTNREAIQQQRLVLISAQDPSAGFNVGHARERNKSIYALADVGLVMTSEINKGGTWAGAVEQLENFPLAPLFVRNAGECGAGNAALIQNGAKPWPEPKNKQEFLDAITRAPESTTNAIQQDLLPPEGVTPRLT